MSHPPKKKLLAIPTNIITGFLGVGKTTAISHLLNQKPDDERWAVLVNEFGEVGIDGTLFQGKKSEEQQVYISEVPGGCMCCAAGLPMQVALNALLKRARPDRLLIEPTGLGHPREVMGVLSSKDYQDALDVQATVTLVDARKVSDTRYSENETFNQQLDIGDVIVANKTDLSSSEDIARLQKHISKLANDKAKPVYAVKNGQLEIEWLEDTASAAVDVLEHSNSHEHDHDHSHEHHHGQEELPLSDSQITFPDEGYISIANQGEGFFSQGWVFKPEFVFDRKKLNTLMLNIQAERAKAVFKTRDGFVGFNKVDDVLTETSLQVSADSRIEIISRNPEEFSDIEAQLLNCA